jgi:hypothetical protein
MNKIRNKRPRTPAGLERKKRVTLNLTEPEYRLIQKNAREAGMTFGAYARRVSLVGKVNARLSEEDKELFREAVAMSNDLHQLWKQARDEGLEDALSSFEAGRNVVDALLNKLKL